MATFLNCSFFSQKDLASTFLSLEDSLSLPTTGSVESDLEGILERVVTSEQQLQDWKTKVENCYFDAFNKSGKTLDVVLEKRNFHELKNVVRSRESLRLFCIFLSAKTDPTLTESVRKRRVTCTARDLKKQRESLTLQNQSLVISVLNARADLLEGLSSAKKALEESIRRPSLLQELTGIEEKKTVLCKDVEEAEREGLRLLEAMKELETTGLALQESIESERSEIATLKEQLSFAKQSTVSKKEQQHLQEQKRIRVIHGIQLVTSFLEKISGVQFQRLSGTDIVFLIKTGVITGQHRNHEVSLQLDPSTMLVTSSSLSPDLGSSMMSTNGLTVQSAIYLIKRAVFEHYQKNS